MKPLTPTHYLGFTLAVLSMLLLPFTAQMQTRPPSGTTSGGQQQNVVITSGNAALPPMTVQNKTGSMVPTWQYNETNGHPMGGVNSNASGFGVGTITPERSLHVIGTGIISERTNGDPQLILRLSGTVAQDWRFRVSGPDGAFVLRDGTPTASSLDILKVVPDSAIAVVIGTNGLGVGAVAIPAALIHASNTAASAVALMRIGSNAVVVESNGVVKIQGSTLMDTAFTPLQLPDGRVLTGGDWVINEQFIGDTISFGSTGTAGDAPWRYGTAGTVPANPSALLEANWTGYLSLVTTQSTSGQTLYIGSSGGGQMIGMTNGAGFIMARIRIAQTNLSGDVSTLRVGLARADIAAEPGSGGFIMINTNANTNTLVCVTSRNSTRVFTYTSYTWTPMQWFNVAMYFDTSGTTAVFYAGTTAANMTAIATNITGLPGVGFTQVNPWINNWRICSSAGTVTQTNYVDYYKFWARSDAQ